MKIVDKTCNFISLYRFPSQSKDEFEFFVDNLKLNLDSVTLRNPYLIIVLGDFNAQTKGWYPLGKKLSKTLELMVLRLDSDWIN